MSAELRKVVMSAIRVPLQRLQREAPSLGRSAAAILTRAVKDEIRSADAVATGKFLRSVRSNVSVTAARNGNVSVAVRVSSDISYAPFVLRGRRPGKMPPVAAIAAWIAVKNLDLPAYPVARAIGRRGIRARDFFARGWRRSRAAVRAAVMRRVIDATVLP